jgi:hypothetical protein
LGCIWGTGGAPFAALLARYEASGLAPLVERWGTLALVMAAMMLGRRIASRALASPVAFRARAQQVARSDAAGARGAAMARSRTASTRALTAMLRNARGGPVERDALRDALALAATGSRARDPALRESALQLVEQVLATLPDGDALLHADGGRVVGELRAALGAIERNASAGAAEPAGDDDGPRKRAGAEAALARALLGLLQRRMHSPGDAGSSSETEEAQ